MESENANYETALGGLNDATGYVIDGDRVIIGEQGELIGVVARR